MNVYISFHYTTYGIAFFKHILSCFYKLNTTDATLLEGQPFDQDEVSEIFDTPHEDAITFDKVYYLTAEQNIIDSVTSSRHSITDSFEKDEIFNKYGLVEIYKDLHREGSQVMYNIDKEIEYVRQKYPDKLADFQKYMWRDIQHYDIDQQIHWLKTQSNFSRIYPEKNFEVKKIKAKDLHNEIEIAHEVKKFISSLKSISKCVINISLGGSEVMSVWHILAANNLLPKNTTFIKSYDDKKVKKHFKPFTIKTISTRLYDDISTKVVLYPNSKSPKRTIANEQIKVFLTSGFSVLLLGERGTGKSSSLRKIADKLKKEDKIRGEIKEANCASFTDSNIAESELFGYDKGAFTGASKDKDGLIKHAENGILFLDEFHHLDKMIQAKLMSAFQTDSENNIHIRRVGSDSLIKVKNVKLVFATNRSIEELHKELLPDFYDRVVQYVVKIPSIRETLEDLPNDWKEVFERLYPDGTVEAPTDPKIYSWLRSLPLKGNFRDLENIAKDYKIFSDFDMNTRKGVCKQLKISLSPFEYAKKCYELYHSNPTIDDKIEIPVPTQCTEINDNNLYKKLKSEFPKRVREWAINKFGSRKEAAKQLGVTERIMNNWK